MSLSEQTLAASRPRIKQDVLYSQTAEGVLFHNAELGFHVASKSAYRLTSVLVPYLNGGHTLEELCGGLGEGQRAMVTDIVSALLERGFARDTSTDRKPETDLEPAVAERFAAQISYIDHYADSPQHRFARLRAARVAVIGDDLVARWCVTGLIRNGVSKVGILPSVERPENGFADVREETAALVAEGCPVELSPLDPADLGWAALSGFDAVVISAADLGPGLVTGLLAEGIPPGVLLLGATAYADQVVIGPAMASGRPGCWVCAALRFGAHRPAAAAELWSRMVVPPADPQSRLSAPHAATVGNLLGYEVFRVLTGAMPAETEGTVIVQRLDSLDAVAEKLLPHPACPYCPVAESGPVPRLVPVSAPTAGADTADQADAAQSLLVKTTDRLLSANVGVFTRFEDDQFTQLPLKVARLRLPLGHHGERVVTAFDTHHAVGARTSVVLAAAQVYAERVGPLPGLLPAPEGARAVGFAELVIGSGDPAGAGRPASWTRATSVLTGEAVVLPAAAVRPFSAYNRQGFCVATAAGTGAGHTPAEALGAGLASALAYDALIRCLHGAPARGIDPSEFAPEPELEFLRASADTLEIAVELIDLGEDRVSGLHVLLARAPGPASAARPAPLWTIGADLNRSRAAAQALRDLIGGVQVTREFPGETVDPGDELLRAFDPYTLRLDGTTGAAATGPDETWTSLLGRIGAGGRDVFSVPTAPADLRSAGIETVRVLLVNGA